MIHTVVTAEVVGFGDEVLAGLMGGELSVDQGKEVTSKHDTRPGRMFKHSESKEPLSVLTTQNAVF